MWQSKIKIDAATTYVVGDGGMPPSTLLHLHCFFRKRTKKKLHVIILDYYTAFVEDSLALANHMHDTVTV